VTINVLDTILYLTGSNNNKHPHKTLKNSVDLLGNVVRRVIHKQRFFVEATFHVPQKGVFPSVLQVPQRLNNCLGKFTVRRGKYGLVPVDFHAILVGTVSIRVVDVRQGNDLLVLEVKVVFF